MAKKLTLEQLIEKTDAAKKANPLDLSSDQDLSIALMNLISLEEHFFFSGAKTKKPGFYDLIQVVRSMRGELMKKIAKNDSAEDGEVWCISKHLLAASMRVMEVGTKALAAGKKKEAYDLFDKAYDLYSLFWGVNMNLIDLEDVKKDETLPDGLREWIGDAATESNEPTRRLPPTLRYGAISRRHRSERTSAPIISQNDSSKKSLTTRLGAWVKDTVNCCIE
jgi:hypothetical protein